MDMKTIKIIICLAVILVGSSCFQLDLNRPFKWYDAQGDVIVKQIQQEHVIPKSGENQRGEIYTKGWAYKENGEWYKGSQITIYGIIQKVEQDSIITTIKKVINSQSYNKVKVTFYNPAEYKVSEGKDWRKVSRVDVKELRVEIIK